ncbi:MAG: ABC transporter ATP-binding protein/permease [Malacoplasma sp.]|nr:ABC transporter ATP-binding protein/permease [Malacoplasma sp.]
MLKLLKFLKGKDLFLVCFSLFLTLIQVVCDISQPFLLEKVGESISATNIDEAINSTWIWAGAMIGLAFGSLIIGIISTFTTARVGVRLGSIVRFETYSRIQTLTSKELDYLTTPSLINRLTNDIMNYQNVMILVFRVIFRSVLLFFGGLFATFVYSSELLDVNGNSLWWLGFVFIGFLVFMTLTIGLVMIKAIPYFKKQQIELDRTNSIMRENILGIRVVKALNLQNQEIKKFDKQNASLRDMSTKGQIFALTAMPIIIFVIQVSVVAILMIAGPSLSDQDRGLATVVMSFIQMISLVVMGLMLSIMVLMNISSTKASCDRINEVLSSTPSIPKNTSKNYIQNSKVEFKNVYFKYFDNDISENVLENISFTANPGEMIGIIGPTGSGKSTLVNLITRNYDVTQGSISISDINLKEINYNSLRDSISVSPQKSILFSGTIASNIRYGKSDATEEELIEAAKKAEAYEFIINKENSFDSIVEQRGTNFSGGQKQRLSIARALVRKPKILILDDSTSALDMITEAKVQQNIRLFKQSTIFLVGQRISAISRADKIIVLDSGKMVGFGTHNQLMKNCSLYKEIAISQQVNSGGAK